MKRIYLFILLFSFAGLPAFAQKLNKAPVEALGLKETSFDFGKIPQGRPVTHHFEVMNNSNKPILIENIEAACGCTTPEWTQEPIAPGDTSLIKIGFNASSEGKFQKTITIYYGDKVKGLTISGEVYPMPTTSAPPNTSLSTLKQ